MNYLDLFSGIGGFHLGFERAGWKFDKVYFSEIDKYATKIYEKHFPDAVGLGDIRNIKTGELGKVDLVTFGFPCQDLSIAGKRAGLGGARSGLFFEAMRIIKELRPSLFIFENVKGLLTSNDGKDFEVVLREIADIGLYECEWQLLNTSWFLPQNRERIYFIGHLGKGSFGKVFPIGENNKGIIKRTKQATVNTLSAGGHSGGMHSSMTLITRTPLKFLNRNQRNYEGDYAFTIDGVNTGGILIIENTKKSIRRLTPIECERLQGFPDNWTEGIAETQRYKCLGNAVTVDVVFEIAKRLTTPNKGEE